MDEQSAVTFGTEYLQIVALCYPFIGINFLLNGIVRSSGAMYQVLALNIISFWILRFPLASVMSGWLGEIGIAVGIGMSFILSSLVAFLYFRFAKWREKELLDRKSTRLNSSHVTISYDVFCLNKE